MREVSSFIPSVEWSGPCGQAATVGEPCFVRLPGFFPREATRSGPIKARTPHELRLDGSEGNLEHRVETHGARHGGTPSAPKLSEPCTCWPYEKRRPRAGGRKPSRTTPVSALRARKRFGTCPHWSARSKTERLWSWNTAAARRGALVASGDARNTPPARWREEGGKRPREEGHWPSSPRET